MLPCRNGRVTLAQLSVLRLLAQDASQTNGTPQLPPVTVQGENLTPIPQPGSSAVTVVSGDEVRVGEVESTRACPPRPRTSRFLTRIISECPNFQSVDIRENNFGVGEPVVGLYVDDVPYFDLNSRGMSLFDVQQIQIARGEQGAVYGASGPGGVINVITRQPVKRLAWLRRSELRQLQRAELSTGRGGALITNKLYLGIDGVYALRIGYVYNNFLHDTPDSQDTLGGRAVLRWTPSDPWTITVSAGAERYNDGFVPTYLPGADANPFSVSRNLNGFVDTDNVNESLKVAYAPGPFKVVSVTTHRDWRQNLLQDFDFSALPLVNGFSNPRVEQWSQELRVQSADDAEKFKWLGGFFFLDNDLHGNSGSEEFFPITSLPPPLPNPLAPPTTLPTVTRSQNDTYAVFGQGTYTVLYHLDLTAGLRFTDDDREMLRVRTLQNAALGALTLGASDLSGNFTDLEPKFALAWHFTPAIEVYGSVAAGYQSGGFNPSVDSATLARFAPERSWQYELGAKSRWLEDRLSAHAALFYNDMDNYQTFRISPIDPTQSFLVNAHRAAAYGAELELTARPIDELDLNAGAGYTDARYKNFLDPTTGKQLAGQPISFVPQFTLNLSATYHFPWRIYARGEVIGVGHYTLDDTYDIASGPTAQSSYALVNAQVGYADKHFEVYFFARNIFDRHYFNDGLNLGYPSLVLQPGDPATFGVAATARF